jgi:hypothetical protein
MAIAEMSGVEPVADNVTIHRNPSFRTEHVLGVEATARAFAVHCGHPKRRGSVG